MTQSQSGPHMTQLACASTRWVAMANTIDCSRMSHVSCVDEPGASESVESTQAPGAVKSSEGPQPAGVTSLRDGEGSPVGAGASYECVNDCVSSQGVTALLSSATISLGCLMVPPACPVFIGTGVGALLGACEVACEDLESKP
jgi:hypothetical protein